MSERNKDYPIKTVFKIFIWNKYYLLHVSMEQSNQKRSLMAKYNHIVSNPDKNLGKYSRDELIDIYDYVSDRNERQRELNLDDVKDLSVLEHVLYNDVDDIWYVILICDCYCCDDYFCLDSTNGFYGCIYDNVFILML